MELGCGFGLDEGVLHRDEGLQANVPDPRLHRVRVRVRVSVRVRVWVRARVRVRVRVRGRVLTCRAGTSAPCSLRYFHVAASDHLEPSSS